MEENTGSNPTINPKAFIITVAILLLIPVVYVLFIKKDAVETPVAQPAEQAATGSAQTPASTTEQIEALKKAVVESPTESNFVNLGMAYYFNKQYAESISASRKAIAINPNNALAYNNICSSYNNMSMWDSAIIAGEAALRIKPDFQLAKNNVAWALQMKQKQ